MEFISTLNLNVELPFVFMAGFVVHLIPLISELMIWKGEMLDAAFTTTKFKYCSSTFFIKTISE